MSKMREQFEEALKTNPDARFWNTTDAMFWAWQAALSTSPLLGKNDQTEVAVARVDMSDSANTAPRKELIFINGSLATLPVGSLLYARPQPDSNELVELRRDAERYRWLRDGEPTWDVDLADAHGKRLTSSERFACLRSKNWDGVSASWRVEFFTDYGRRSDEDNLDKAIDAALAQSPSKKGGE